jgi:hypothetical protein
MLEFYLKQPDLKYKNLGEEEIQVEAGKPAQRIGKYQVGSTLYAINLTNKVIISIDNTRGCSQTGGQNLTSSDLELKARSILADLAPHVDLSRLAALHVQKMDISYFHWAEVYQLGYIELALCPDGQVYTFNNTLSHPKG